MAIRVLHVVTYMGRGGLETMLMNYYRHMDRDKVQFDFLVHRDFEADFIAGRKNLPYAAANSMEQKLQKKAERFFACASGI